MFSCTTLRIILTTQTTTCKYINCPMRKKEKKKKEKDTNWPGWHLGYYQAWNKNTNPMMVVLSSQWLHVWKPPCTAVVCFVVPLAYWSLFSCVCVECRFSTASLAASSAFKVCIQYNLYKKKEKKEGKQWKREVPSCVYIYLLTKINTVINPSLRGNKK